jgi:hypothetical protein
MVANLGRDWQWGKNEQKGFNLKKLNEVEGEEQHYAEISYRFAALESLHAEVH